MEEFPPPKERKEIVSVSHTPSSKPRIVEFFISVIKTSQCCIGK